MFLVGGFFCTVILALLMAGLFGDLPVHIAWPLASGFSCIGLGWFTLAWPRFKRRLMEPMQATRAAREIAQPPATTWTALSSLLLVIAGSVAIWATLAAFVVRL